MIQKNCKVKNILVKALEKKKKKIDDEKIKSWHSFIKNICASKPKLLFPIHVIFPKIVIE